MRTLDSRFAAARNCIVTKPLRAPAATLARAAASNQLLKGNTLVLHRAPFVSIIRILLVASLVVGMSSCGGQGGAPGSTPPPSPGSSNPGSNSGSSNGGGNSGGGTPAPTPGNITALNHIIFMFQENRSFDHYF